MVKYTQKIFFAKRVRKWKIILIDDATAKNDFAVAEVRCQRSEVSKNKEL